MTVNNVVQKHEEWKNIDGDINVDTTVDSDVEKIVGLIGHQYDIGLI